MSSPWNCLHTLIGRVGEHTAVFCSSISDKPQRKHVQTHNVVQSILLVIYDMFTPQAKVAWIRLFLSMCDLNLTVWTAQIRHRPLSFWSLVICISNDFQSNLYLSNFITFHLIYTSYIVLYDILHCIQIITIIIISAKNWNWPVWLAVWT